jgi:hypothetical protein
MYKGTNEITNKGLGFKLMNSLSFGESMIYAGFNQETVKADLHVRVNNTIPPWNQCGKVLENSRGYHTEARGRTLPCGADRPYLQAARPLGPPIVLPTAMSVSYCLLGCISIIS